MRGPGLIASVCTAQRPTVILGGELSGLVNLSSAIERSDVDDRFAAAPSHAHATTEGSEVE